ncbi:MAG: hypothetical protein P4M08_00405 [Oligoflexia bacterium]|nr:hypothetical protein [Oligoflexia bacterium]
MKNILLGSLGLVLSQVAITLALAPGNSLAERYLALNNWDSFHYRRIAETGYTLPPSGVITSDSIHQGLANAVFFPGYPILVRLASQATEISVPWMLPLLAQLAAFVFWLYLLLYLRAHGSSARRALSTVAIIALHPAAYYLVAGYSESLFLAMMMGFLYWSEGSGWKRAIAAAHGLMMSATRIVAFAPAAYPFFKSLDAADLKAPGKALIRHWKEVLLGISAIAGAILFFAYCQLRFGQWDLYFKLEKIGWGNERLWLAIFNPLSYVPHFFFENFWDSLNRLAVTWTAAHLWVTARDDRKLGFRDWPLWITAFLLFYIPVTGKASAHLESMLRYTLPVTVLLLVLQATQFPDRAVFQRRPKTAYVLALVSLALQCWCAYRFLRGRWIA